MSYFIVDVEADGPCPGLYSMVSIGVVKLDRKLDTTYYGQTKPISEQWIPEALAISGHTRTEHLLFDNPKKVMEEITNFVKENNNKGRPTLISDNNGFDAAFVNYYMHRYLSDNIFGWSSRRIGDLFCGATKNASYRWKKHRKTTHSHHPVDDAKGNAEALIYLSDTYGIKLGL